MKDLSVDHLLGIKSLTKSDIDIIFETADSFKRVINRPIRKVPTLRDITIANIFFENSTRTNFHLNLPKRDYLLISSISLLVLLVKGRNTCRYSQQHTFHESRHDRNETSITWCSSIFS